MSLLSTLQSAAPRGERGSTRPALGHLEAINVVEPYYEDVNVVSLGGFFAKILTPPVGFVKIDVEGGELGVLRGASNFLKTAHLPPILIEVNGHCLNWFGETPNTLLALAAEIGYQPYRFESGGLRPVGTDFLDPLMKLDYSLIGPADVGYFERYFLPPLSQIEHHS